VSKDFPHELAQPLQFICGSHGLSMQDWMVCIV